MRGIFAGGIYSVVNSGLGSASVLIPQGYFITIGFIAFQIIQAADDFPINLLEFIAGAQLTGAYK